MLTSGDILTSLPRYFQPDPDSRKITVVYEIYDPTQADAACWTVIVGQDDCTVEERAGDQFDTRVAISEKDYIRLVYGKMDYGSAIWMGRIRLSGSCLAHEELNTRFRFPKELEIAWI
jgi:putative sterol carrier protein